MSADSCSLGEVCESALAIAGDRERILAAGADAYLSKPAPLAILGREIDRLLGAGRA